jgi:hypothetical protein
MLARIIASAGGAAAEYLAAPLNGDGIKPVIFHRPKERRDDRITLSTPGVATSFSVIFIGQL